MLGFPSNVKVKQHELAVFAMSQLKHLTGSPAHSAPLSMMKNSWRNFISINSLQKAYEKL